MNGAGRNECDSPCLGVWRWDQMNDTAFEEDRRVYTGGRRRKKGKGTKGEKREMNRPIAEGATYPIRV